MMLAERLARLFRYPAVTLDGNIEYLPLSFPASAPLKPTPPKASLALRLLHFAGQPGDVLGLETLGGPQQRRQLDRSALDDVGEVRRHPARPLREEAMRGGEAPSRIQMVLPARSQ